MFGQGIELEHQGQGLSDQQISDLIASVGNGEHKALLTCSLNPDEIIDEQLAFAKFVGMQGKFPVWQPGHGVPFQYVEDSFSQVGSEDRLVVREVFDADSTVVGYQITKHGLDTAVPFAGHLLSFSERYKKPSLFQIWGPTETAAESEIRAPSFRLKFYRHILNAPLPVRQVDLIKELRADQSSVVRHHLARLKAFGIITMESNAACSYYQLAEEKEGQTPHGFKLFKGRRSTIQLVNDIFQNRGSNALIRFNSLIDELVKLDADRANMARNTLRTAVSNACLTLAEQGFLIPDSSNTVSDSKITLTDHQRMLIEEVISIVDRFQSQDPDYLKLGKYLACEIVYNPRRVLALMEKAKQTSPYVKRFIE